MIKMYNKNLSTRQKSLLKKYNKAKARIQQKIDQGIFTQLGNREQATLLARLRRYALQLQRVGFQVRHAAVGTALALALSVGNTADAQIVFTEQTGGDNPVYYLDHNYGHVPTFVDIDNDGDMDLFIGTGLNIQYYKNTGSNSSPVFTTQTGTDNPFIGVIFNVNGDFKRYSPTFVDIDNDGDMDAFIGESATTNYYKNTGTNISPTFTEQIGAANPFDGVAMGHWVAPAFVDIDNDGDMDAFIGEFYGTVKYYKNIGSSSSPTFTEQIGAANPFDGVNAGILATPTFVDIDNDGDMDAFIGEASGTVKYYKNTGSNSIPTFTEQTGAANPFDGENPGNTPVFVDIDNDGDMDAFIGPTIYNQITSYYKNESIFLPVELHSFSGQLINEQTQLHWQTASELNNEGFEIQWAIGKEQLAMDNWETLDFINGSGTTNETQNYQFTHDRPAEGTNYYRLKQMDFDGKFEYSDIEAIQFNNGQNTQVQIFPNPVKDGLLTVELEGELETELLLQVYDLTGKKVLQQSSFEKSNQLDVSALSSGIFMVEIVANGQITREKVVIE